MFIASTTVASRADADLLAASAVEKNLAVCVQIAGPVTSYYRWSGTVEKAEEYRLTFKVLPAHLTMLETWINQEHSYAVPEWIVLRAEQVGEKYLSWARANPNPLPL